MAKKEQVWCSGRVYSGGWNGANCARKASYEEDGKMWCASHAPSKVAERKVAQEAKWAAESAARDRKYERQSAERDAVRLVLEIADGLPYDVHSVIFDKAAAIAHRIRANSEALS